jgi:hypothetical protein
MKNPYNLTPLGPEWNWTLRVLEIVGQTLSLIFFQPIVWLHNGSGWLLEKFFNS